jgi:hypothetical protein
MKEVTAAAQTHHLQCYHDSSRVVVVVVVPPRTKCAFRLSMSHRIAVSSISITTTIRMVLMRKRMLLEEANASHPHAKMKDIAV